jgi:peptide/nickel transport system substrate-binding protein
MTTGARHRRRWQVIGVFTLGACVLAGVPAAAAERSKDDVVVGLGLLGPSLDPQIQFAVPIYALVRHIFDPLVEFDAQNRIVPKLAESWRVVDPTAWEFTLRKGVKFHNGEPFTADSVKFTLERVVKPETKSPQAFVFAWLVTSRSRTPIPPS